MSPPRGGKRAGAGRPVSGRANTVVIRVDAKLAPTINQLKEDLKKNGAVNFNQDNHKLVKINDELRSKIIQQGKEIRNLKSKAEELMKIKKVDDETIDRLISESHE